MGGCATSRHSRSPWRSRHSDRDSCRCTAPGDSASDKQFKALYRAAQRHLLDSLKPSGKNTMITVLAAVLSGVMFYLSQGYDHVWALAWLAPVPLLWLAYGNTTLVAGAGGERHRRPGRRRLSLAIPVPAPHTAARPRLGSGGDVGLFCVAVWFARFVQHRASPLLTLFAFPACWTAFEFLMQQQSPNGTYGSLAYSTMSAPVLIQSASLFGMYAVTFLICLLRQYPCHGAAAQTRSRGRDRPGRCDLRGQPRVRDRAPGAPAAGRVAGGGDRR